MTEGGSAIRRLFGRLQRAWDSGALWVALVCGMGFLPGFPLVLFVATTVVSSGASTGTQIFAVILFVVAMFTVFEVAVVSHLIAPCAPKLCCSRCTTGRWPTAAR
ncbi:integral membrane protein [Mycolicibacterium fortuitum]|uniref:Integral membrane protein n=1 Tax=Mycolicibacterium fortuitum TaxID=1766 RepID=A0A378UC83_MYCFO|nr:integral membrane protein [Mycolicibacterium fortuitum]